MANPAQKTILLEQTYDKIKISCTTYQDEYFATDMELKNLLREFARVWEKENKWNYCIKYFLPGISI